MSTKTQGISGSTKPTDNATQNPNTNRPTSDEAIGGSKDELPRHGKSSSVDAEANTNLYRLAKLTDSAVAQLTAIHARMDTLTQRMDTLEGHIKLLMDQWELRFGKAGTHCERCGRGLGVGETTHNCGGSALTNPKGA